MSGLQPHEQEVLERLEKIRNPLGWKPVGRDERGHGILEATMTAGPGKLKVARMVLRPEGIENFDAQVIDVN